MSMNSVLGAGLSALSAAQTGMKVASQNIANANSPGYVRTEAIFSPAVNLGAGGGVDVLGVRRATDRFLSTATFIAEATAGGAAARSQLLSRAQSYFGDPTSSTSLFANIDRVWSTLADLQVDPSSALARDDVVNALNQAFGTLQETANSVQGLIQEADERLSSTVAEVQNLITQISDLNEQIALTMRAGAEPSNVQNAQSALVDQLSKLLDVRVEARNDGGISVRTAGGALLVGAGPATLQYTASGEAYSEHATIQLNPQFGGNTNLEPYVSGGEIAGLLQARDQDLPALAEALGSMAAALADQLNKVHNENTSSPASSSLVGRQTGMLATDALVDTGGGVGFTGVANIGVLNANGVLTARHVVDFDNSQIVSEYPIGVFTTTAFTNSVGAFATALNTALGIGAPAGTVSFSGGVLSLNASGGGGIVIQQDAGSPSDREGRGFSHFFGLNDVAGRVASPLFFEAGARGTDLTGLTAGQTLDFTVKDTAGRVQATRTITVTNAIAAGDWNSLLTALNNNTGTGVGEYATFAFNADGRVVMTPGANFDVAITGDATQRTGTGVSFTGLFGLTPSATAKRAEEVTTRSVINSEPGKLAVARPDMANADLGERIIEIGDNRGAAALLAARDTNFNIGSAGALTAQATTLALYSSRLGGAAGRLANDADRHAKGAAAVAAAASDRRAQVEGVSLDDELLRMTTFQNSYAAAARVIQAANDMFDILFQIGT